MLPQMTYLQPHLKWGLGNFENLYRRKFWSEYLIENPMTYRVFLVEVLLMMGRNVQSVKMTFRWLLVTEVWVFPMT